MRLRITALVWASLIGSAAAIPFVPPPQPVYEAPIDRALQNVSQMEGLEPAQRERLLGRLNLLAYARNDGNFAYLSDGDQFNEPGSVKCTQADRPTRGMGGPTPQRDFAPNALCARRDYNLGPEVELPQDPVAAPNAQAHARLLAAESHYRQAIALDGNDLRARLGHAYTLDRLGRISDARRDLREIIRLGLPRLTPQSNWDDHVVLTEAAEHLAHLARSAGDRRKLEQLRARLQASRPMIYVTPMVAPLTDAPFAAMIDPNADAAFDFAGTGDRRAQGWLTPDAAWLVWDPERRGQVRSGFDMIGARTWAVFWSDGFEVLRALDDDRDGELRGAELGGLALWRDADSDGVSDPGEVRPVSEHGVAALSVRGERTRDDLITAPAGLRLKDGSTRPLYDWTPGLNAGPVS